MLTFSGVLPSTCSMQASGAPSDRLCADAPVAMAVAGTRQKLSMIVTVTNPGKARWMTIEDAFDADKSLEFLQSLIKDAGKKVFLVLDNLRVHHSKMVKAWIADR